MPKENDLEGQQDQSGKLGGQNGCQNPSQSRAIIHRKKLSRRRRNTDGSK
jgi:hypothetical protein